MEPNLISGDYILVNKLVMGPRIFNLVSALNKEDIKIHRLPGLRNIKHNDILVFNFPYSVSQDSISFDIMKYYIKRCIGLPGDTLQIRNGLFQITGISERLGNYKSQQYISTLVDSVKHIQMDSYPWNKGFNWTIKEFGPLPIPIKGQQMEMNKHTYSLYHQIISWEQKQKLKFNNNKVLLGDSAITNYEFLKNYYFMAGDKLQNSQDSRYWGLLPEEYIVGKASLIWNSTEPASNKTRWNRILRSIK